MPEDTTTASSIIHREIKDDQDPEVSLIHMLAEIKGVDESELAPLYSCIGSMVDNLFRSPPPAEATAELTFSYQGYRITIYQDGHIVFQQSTAE